MRSPCPRSRRARPSRAPRAASRGGMPAASGRGRSGPARACAPPWARPATSRCRSRAGPAAPLRSPARRRAPRWRRPARPGSAPRRGPAPRRAPAAPPCPPRARAPPSPAGAPRPRPVRAAPRAPRPPRGASRDRRSARAGRRTGPPRPPGSAPARPRSTRAGSGRASARVPSGPRGPDGFPGRQRAPPQARGSSSEYSPKRREPELLHGGPDRRLDLVGPGVLGRGELLHEQGARALEQLPLTERELLGVLQAQQVAQHLGGLEDRADLQLVLELAELPAPGDPAARLRALALLQDLPDARGLVALDRGAQADLLDPVARDQDARLVVELAQHEELELAAGDLAHLHCLDARHAVAGVDGELAHLCFPLPGTRCCQDAPQSGLPCANHPNTPRAPDGAPGPSCARPAAS